MTLSYSKPDMNKKFEQITTVLARSLGLETEQFLNAFQRATAADFEAICALRRLGFGREGEMDEKILSWRYFDSSKQCSDIYVLKYHGKVIAAVGAEPIQVELGGALVEGVRTADIVVHPDHLKRGIGGWMNLFMQHHYRVVMAMGANENSSSMVRRVFKPMNCRRHFKLLLSCKSYLLRRGIPGLAAQLVDGLVWQSYRFLLSSKLRRFSGEFTVDTHASVSSLALYFQQPGAEGWTKKGVRRDFDFCHWRFELNPKSDFQCIVVSNVAGPLAYAIVKTDSNNSGDYYLMDWSIVREYKNIQHWKCLLAEVVAAVKSAGGRSIAVLASDELSVSGLCQSTFSERAKDDAFYLYADQSLGEEVLNENAWYITYADTDEML